MRNTTFHLWGTHNCLSILFTKFDLNLFDDGDNNDDDDDDNNDY